PIWRAEEQRARLGLGRQQLRPRTDAQADAQADTEAHAQADAQAHPEAKPERIAGELVARSLAVAERLTDQATGVGRPLRPPPMRSAIDRIRNASPSSVTPEMIA